MASPESILVTPIYLEPQGPMLVMRSAIAAVRPGFDDGTEIWLVTGDKIEVKESLPVVRAGLFGGAQAANAIRMRPTNH